MSGDKDTGPVELPRPQGRVGQILKRAAATYLALFFGLGVMMSLLDSHPLANNGLMPKLLLLFVGVATLIALAAPLIDYSRQQDGHWLSTLVKAALKKIR